MEYEELLRYLKEHLDAQTASRLAEAIIDAGGISNVLSLLENL